VSDSGLNYLIQRKLKNGQVQTWKVHRERLWRRVEKGLQTLFGDPVREYGMDEVFPEARYDPQDLLPTDNSVLRMEGGVRDPTPPADSPTAGVSGDSTPNASAVNMFVDECETDEPHDLFDLTLNWDDWIESWERWYLGKNCTGEPDLAPDRVANYLHEAVHKVYHEVLAEGPSPWQVFKSRMRQRIREEQTALTDRIVASWRRPEDSAVYGAWEDTDISRKRTIDLLAELARGLVKNVRNTVILAEINRRSRDWVIESRDVVPTTEDSAPAIEYALEASNSETATAEKGDAGI
jgi:hypothetical protein